MYDLRGEAFCSRAIEDMIYYHRPTLTEIYSGKLGPFIENSLGKPSAVLFHPIFKDYCSYEVVGAISTVFTIGSQISGLPENVNGMTCVIETNAGQEFTYNLDGGGYAQLVGEGDLHETKYDDMLLERAFDLQSYHVYDHDEREAGCARRAQEHYLEGKQPLPTGAEQLLGDGPAPGFGVGSGNDGERNPPVVMTAKIYPSTIFEGQYMTRIPGTHVLAILLIFLVTSATFLIYDCLAKRRQDVVMKTAVKSTKIVHNLFPSNVRDRLFNDEDKSEEDGNSPIPGFVPQDGYKGGNGHGDADDNDKTDVDTLKQCDPSVRKERDPVEGTGSIGNFKSSFVSRTAGGLSKTPSNLSRVIDDDAMLGANATGRGLQGPPIADLFTDATIMFADIAGFTAWSSEREPVQVFQLLEALYREFDITAKRAGVFKVETIGDCYGECRSILMVTKAKMSNIVMYSIFAVPQLIILIPLPFLSPQYSRRHWPPRSPTRPRHNHV